MGLPMGLPSLTFPFILLGFGKFNEFLFFFCSEKTCSSEDCYYKSAIKIFLSQLSPTREQKIYLRG